MIAPQFATHRIGSATASHTLELFLDLVCPFSKKQLNGVRNELIPLIESNQLVKKHLSVVICQVSKRALTILNDNAVVQPWHSSSTLVHEAALGVSKVLTDKGTASFDDPKVVSKFQEYFFKLMDKQEEYYDEPCAAESPDQTRERLADLAASIGVDRESFVKAISVGKGNSGTSVTNDLKLQTKYHRTRGVHVTPTVFLDGLAEPSISSSFTREDWVKFLTEKVLPPGSKL
ncbi:SPOSA6832_00230 [Sporobolomyces salmonicolor]|uniref:SPOSA6832_00230-mRNA-1:cds n=1 Tax=Sporidiobolus salmonicolor TaxID=5005 RepID=A0A0D6EFU7_SPOSA|nr:SPOSA6832_00230 [Sporobolomyces salmonicolor]